MFEERGLETQFTWHHCGLIVYSSKIMGGKLFQMTAVKKSLRGEHNLNHKNRKNLRFLLTFSIFNF